MENIEREPVNIELSEIFGQNLANPGPAEIINPQPDIMNQNLEPNLRQQQEGNIENEEEPLLGGGNNESFHSIQGEENGAYFPLLNMQENVQMIQTFLKY
jgi:hypothetical protein